jgi:WD40 repeat protein
MVWDSSRNNFDRNLAVVIGIDCYDSSGIHNLSTAVNDANTIANVLQSHYGYREENIIRLLSPRSDDSTLKDLTQPYREATLDNLTTLLTKDLPEKLKPTEGDRLLFYFAGHGIPQESEDGPAGYLIPQTAKLGDLKSYLPMRELHDALKQLSCHHLLIILDCCFGGMFRWASSRKLISVLETVRREHYDRFIRYPAWQVITSAAHNEEALDLSVDHRKGEENSRHSPFAQALIEGLLPDDKGRTKADFIPDGVITAHELFLHLNNRVSELSNSRQTPGIYPMRLEYDKGEYVFTRSDFKHDDLEPAPDLNEENNPYRGLKPFDEKHSSFFFGRNASIRELNDRLAKPSRSLTVVLGASGSGKSSLVKAGLIPYLREKQNKDQLGQQWYILDPMRPGKFPFIEIARSILPIVDTCLTERVKQIKALTDLASDPLADTWNRSTPEAKLLLVVDYFDQLKTSCLSPELKNLKDEIQATVDRLNRELRSNLQYLAQVIATWGQNNPNTKLLLVIDQFEELITMTQEHQEQNQPAHSNGQSGDKEWQQFLTMLKIALSNHPHPLHLVLTLRSDFEPRFLESELKEEWREARFPVGVMNPEELRQAIEGPALKQALVFDPDNLVSTLIYEVGQMPGALPLLAFALSALYIKLHQRWKINGSTARTLTLEDYTKLGGVAGALTCWATEEYDKLVKEKDTDNKHRGGFGAEEGKAYQTTMRRIMLRMVVIEGGVARRRVPITELVYFNEDENERVKTVIERLVNARLIVKGQESEASYIEPAHDFLVRGWDQLQIWIKQNQIDLALQQRLNPAANDWDKHSREPDYLWIRDPRLALLEKVLESETDNWLNQLEEQFVETSKKYRLDELEETKRQLHISERRRLSAEAFGVGNLLESQPLNALTLAIHLIGQNLVISPQQILASVQASLRRVMDSARVPLRITLSPGGSKPQISRFLSVAFSPDGRMIASGDNTIYFWNLQGALIRQPLRGHEDLISSIAFSRKNPMLVSASWDSTIRLWDLRGNPTGQVLRGHNGKVYAVAFSSDGRTIASGGDDSTVRLWDLQGKPVGRPFGGHQRVVTSVAFSPDGQMIVSGSADSTIRLWNLQGSLIGQPFQGHRDTVFSVAFSPDGKFIVSGSRDRTVRLWNLQGGLIGQPFQIGERYGFGSADAVAFSPDGEIIASGSNNVFSIELRGLDGNPIGQPLTEDVSIDEVNHVTSVVFSPDGQTLANSSSNRDIFTPSDVSVRLWDLKSISLGYPLRGHEDKVCSIAFSPDSQTIVSGSWDHTLRLWNLKGKCIAVPFQGHEDKVDSVAFSPDGQMIVSSSADSTIRLWDLQGNQQGKPFRQHEGIITSVAFSLDGQRILSESYISQELGSVTRCWDLQGNLRQEITPDSRVNVQSLQKDVMEKIFQGHGHTPPDAFSGTYRQLLELVVPSPDGQTLVSTGRDGTIRLWDSQGNPIGEPLPGHQGNILSVIFSPNGEVIASAGSDKTIRLWRGNWKSWLKVCCDRLRYHPVFKNPQTEVEKAACETCRKYVWDISNTTSVGNEV